MPRVDVPAVTVTRTGIAVPAEVTGDATNFHSFANDGQTILIARNSAATTTRTVTLLITRTVDGQAATSRTVAVPISTSRYIGPFPVSDYGTLMQFNVDHADLRLTTLSLAGG